MGKAIVVFKNFCRNLGSKDLPIFQWLDQLLVPLETTRPSTMPWQDEYATSCKKTLKVPAVMAENSNGIRFATSFRILFETTADSVVGDSLYRLRSDKREHRNRKRSPEVRFFNS